jgi:hypothetical protein
MAVRFDAGTDQLTLASAPGSTATITMTAWVRNIEGIGNGTFSRLRAASTVASFTASSGGLNGPQLATTGGTAGPIVVGAGSLPLNSWRRVAVVINGTGSNNCTVYWGDASPASDLTSAVGTVLTGVPTALSIGGRGGGDLTERWGGDMAYKRIWTAAFDHAAVKAELASPTHVVTADIWGAWPLTDASTLTDASGHDRHLTAGSTPVTTVDGPPLSAGATLGVATTASTAQALAGTKTAVLSIATGTGSALALAGQKLASLSTATGTGSAMPVVGAKAATLTSVTAISTVLTLAGVKAASLGVASANSVALPLGSGRDITVTATLDPRRSRAILNERRVFAILEAQP